MLNVAILGCGRWGLNHLRTLANLREEGLVKSITVIDTSKEARDAAILADHKTNSIEGVKADLVIIATPSNLHAIQARELMSNGYHVLVEKPLGCCESEAAQVLASAHENGRVMGVGLLLRFHPAVTLAKRVLRNGELGRLESLRFVRRTTRKPPVGGNVIESLGVHAIDLMCHMLSESDPSAVNVEGDSIEARIVLEFPQGIEALIDVGWGTSSEKRTVALVGSQATFRFDLDVHERATMTVNGEEQTLYCDVKHSPLEAEIRHILAAVSAHKSGDSWKAIPDYGAALRGVRWTERAIQALPVSRPH
ncbi:MAG: Gfo/Idh/MocA family oxidoreductase [Euryarchaeota archaeon]|nr:Gfo/Idh/MocA family oxidoreductase [Euryarchaeota archaeon]